MSDRVPHLVGRVDMSHTGTVDAAPDKTNGLGLSVEGAMLTVLATTKYNAQKPNDSSHPTASTAKQGSDRAAKTNKHRNGTGMIVAAIDNVNPQDGYCPFLPGFQLLPPEIQTSIFEEAMPKSIVDWVVMDCAFHTTLPKMWAKISRTAKMASITLDWQKFADIHPAAHSAVRRYTHEKGAPSPAGQYLKTGTKKFPMNPTRDMLGILFSTPEDPINIWTFYLQILDLEMSRRITGQGFHYVGILWEGSAISCVSDLATCNVRSARLTPLSCQSHLTIQLGNPLAGLNCGPVCCWSLAEFTRIFEDLEVLCLLVVVRKGSISRLRNARGRPVCRQCQHTPSTNTRLRTAIQLCETCGADPYDAEWQNLKNLHEKGGLLHFQDKKPSREKRKWLELPETLYDRFIAHSGVLRNLVTNTKNTLLGLKFGSTPTDEQLKKIPQIKVFITPRAYTDHHVEFSEF